MLSGSCLCGAIRYEIAGQLGPHRALPLPHVPEGSRSCIRYNRSHARSDFRWASGEDVVASFESSPGKRRFFCPHCGSHLIAAWDDAPNVIVRIGSLDSDPGTRPVVHIWTSLKAPWHEITDDLPQFSESLANRSGAATGQGA